jgi:hypothetical protein
MDEMTFWALIESHEYASPEIGLDCATLVQTLAERSRQDILDFDRIFARLDIAAYKAELWNAVEVIMCGCSDDGFSDFRSWLISRGATIYHKVLEDPEYLAEIVEIEDRLAITLEELRYVTVHAYQTKTSEDFPYSAVNSNDSIPNVWNLNGKLLDIETSRLVFPRLAAKFSPDCDEDVFGF